MEGPALSHELRNEVIEELTLDLVGESRAEPEGMLMRGSRNRGIGSTQGQKRRETEENQKKKTQGSTRRSELSEEGERRRHETRSRSSLSKAERGGKACRDAAQADYHLVSRWRARIANQPFCPREPIMSLISTSRW